MAQVLPVSAYRCCQSNRNLSLNGVVSLTATRLRLAQLWQGRAHFWRQDFSTQPMQLSGYRTYSITAIRMTSGDELKRLKGLSGLALDLRLIARF